MKYVYDPEHSRPKHTSVSASLCAYAVCLPDCLSVCFFESKQELV